jgi:hypothetical protein
VDAMKTYTDHLTELRAWLVPEFADCPEVVFALVIELLAHERASNDALAANLEQLAVDAKRIERSYEALREALERVGVALPPRIRDNGPRVH